MRKIVVSNSTVIIALDSINKINLLNNLYDEIFISNDVEKELLAGQGKPGSDFKGTNGFMLKVFRIQN